MDIVSYEIGDKARKDAADAKALASTKVGSSQEGSVGTIITNIIKMTSAEYATITPLASTYYIVV